MSLTAKLAAYFEQHEGEWLDGRTLAQVAGAYAWRSRVSNCRTELGMHIDNRQRTVKADDMQFTVSEYRYLKPAVNQVSPDPWSLTAESERV